MAAALVFDLSAYTTTNYQMSFFWMIPAYMRFADQVHPADFRFQSLNEKTYGLIAADSLRGFTDAALIDKPDPHDLKAILKNNDFRQSLLKLHVAHMNFWRLHKDFHEKLLKTRNILMREMDAQGVSYDSYEKINKPQGQNEHMKNTTQADSTLR